MNIRITETNEIRNLTITDPKTGIEWTADLLGNHKALARDDEGIAVLTAADYEWWHDLVAAYQAAEERYAETLGDITDADEAAAMAADYAEAGSACDLEDLPAAIQRLCDTYVFRALAAASEWTVAELAAELGLSKSAVEKRLNGSRAVRRCELVALAKWAE